MSLVRSLARAMMSGIFISGGINQLQNVPQKVEASKDFLDPIVKNSPVQTDAETLVRINGATMVAGGSLLALGKFTRLSSLALIGAVAPTTVGGHPFWKYDDPQQRAMQRTQFLKNLAIAGGLVLAAVDTEGKPGLAYRAKLAKDSVERGAERTRREARYAARAARREAKLAVAQAQNAVS
ncbi:DoxX family membrane protein [Epidermidibacterium keratini]|uniref:DoxX family membrane protein n=1 Tax=Epidermidibacterium keratini TaxID=1891644 RepID=A0A7M3T503_9ACTN|nr:DoxX family protein [Epidermidibacterium keratini]QHB98852.1 DoxX family membrane protein [Epidermidibacterium keratini]